MKVVRHDLPRGISLLEVAEWCHEHETPVVITYMKPRVQPPQELHAEFPPEYIIATGSRIIRMLRGRSVPSGGSWRAVAIVRNRDFNLFRLRF